MKGDLVVVRGGGDLATGVVQKLFRAGLRVLILEKDRPIAVRRTVALCEAAWDGAAAVEDMVCRRIGHSDEAQAVWEAGELPLLVDPQANCLEALQPLAVVDAIVAKRNLGTHRGMAPVTIGLGPGFNAGVDVDAVIETQRGHALGRLILQGPSAFNSGVPGVIGGKGAERVLRTRVDGLVEHRHAIGDVVRQGEAVLTVGGEPLISPIDGLLRGLIRDGLEVRAGMKLADVDPRTNVDWNTISDKSRSLGGSTLEAVLYLARRRGVVPRLAPLAGKD